ncbi:MAG: hypothetical protein J6A21_08070 [Lentisphaeria bacterium]|nr:hypothetical protein [Lentisphaeria bacterium]
MKRRFALLLAGAILVTVLPGGCLSSKTASPEKCCPAEQKQGKKLKTGFFVGDGSNGNGVFLWARLLQYSPQIELTLLDGEDIRKGALSKLDLLVIPGGSSRRQYLNVTEEGGEKIREFVKKGGSYVGICAGFHCTLDKPDRFRLMPYTYRQGAGGFRAKVAIDINEQGAKLLEIPGGRYFVSYSRGPISKEVKKWQHGQAETLAVYRSTVSHIGKNSDFMGAPAMIFGNYGKGKVIATSFHPEMHRQNDPISMGCIYAVTGIRPTPLYPEKVFRPVRAAFLTTPVSKESIRELLELDREKELDVRLLSSSEIGDGLLLHTDAVILSNCEGTGPKGVLKNCKKAFLHFLDRGGRILTRKKIDGYPEHRNIVIVPAGTSFAQAALKKQ